MNARRCMRLVRPFCRRVDHLADLRDLRRRKAADLRVLANDVLIFGEIDAERLVVGDIGFKPLDVRTKLAQYPIRFCCCSAKLFALEGADLWNIPFDDKLPKCHVRLSLTQCYTPPRGGSPARKASSD